MWSARPFNSDSPDPFGRNQGVGERPLSAESAKCPSCASNIVFRPEVRGMVCRNCGNIYNASTLEKMGSLGYTIEHDYTSDSEISDDDKKRHEIVCDSCGATMIADGYPFIPYGKLTIVQGDPGDGKTTLVLNIAAKLSKGVPMDEGMQCEEPIDIISQ